jgi:hypothetical protein
MKAANRKNVRVATRRERAMAFLRSERELDPRFSIWGGFLMRSF